jgi:hypothetical protein
MTARRGSCLERLEPEALLEGRHPEEQGAGLGGGQLLDPVWLIE